MSFRCLRGSLSPLLYPTFEVVGVFVVRVHVLGHRVRSHQEGRWDLDKRYARGLVGLMRKMRLELQGSLLFW